MERQSTVDRLRDKLLVEYLSWFCPDIYLLYDFLCKADENSDVFKTWYPPLEKTLSCLSKLYRCLEPTVFTGLAQEAVEVCSDSIQKFVLHYFCFCFINTGEDAMSRVIHTHMIKPLMIRQQGR
ncbi:hypothetical protein CsSME_00008944 [Camellia sinensis var. sinensis]